MQQGRTGCKRQSKAPLPAPGACTGRDVQGGKALPPSLRLHRETCLDGMAVTTTHGSCCQDMDLCHHNTELAVTYWSPGRCARAASRRPPSATATACTSPEQWPCPGDNRDTRLLLGLRQGRALAPQSRTDMASNSITHQHIKHRHTASSH